MSKSRCTKWLLQLAVVMAVTAITTTASAQNFLFKFPRQGGFKFKHDDSFDFTNAQHFAASGMVAVGIYDLIHGTSIRKPKVMAGIMATMIGLLKEFEDGYREGWDPKDVMFNEIGIATFLLFNQYTHFTLTMEQVFTGTEDYGAALRFFRTSDFTPWKASLGFYLLYNNHREKWMGMDLHFSVLQKLEVHAGVSAVNLAYANVFEFRPNLGFGIRLF